MVAFNGMTVEKSLRDIAAYMRQKDADEAYPKEILNGALDRHRQLRSLTSWMPPSPDRGHVALVADTMRDLAVGIVKILWPLKTP